MTSKKELAFEQTLKEWNFGANTRAFQFYQKYVCGEPSEPNFAGTKFSCALPKGHGGEHEIEPVWEMMATIRFLLKHGYTITKALEESEEKKA